MPIGEHRKTWFPGLRPGETEVWREYLFDHETEHERFEYDVHIGPGVQAPLKTPSDFPDLDKRLEQAYYRSTQHRIDVVGYLGPGVTLFEVETRAGAEAIGQIITYRELWKREKAVLGPVRSRIVARSLAPGLAEVCDRNGIHVSLVG